SALVTHLIHHGVTRIHTQATINTFRLQAIANIDVYRTDLHTPGTIDTVAQALGFVIFIRLTRTTLLAAQMVVRHSQRILVVHHRLEARVRTHVFTDLLTQEACVHVGRPGKEQDPERRREIRLESYQAIDQVADRDEVAYEGKRRNKGNDNPHGLRSALAPELFKVPGLRIQLDSFVPVRLKEVCGPDKHLGPDRLWTGEAAPHPSHKHSGSEQHEGSNNQQPCQVHTVVGPERHPENMEFALGKIEQHGGTPIDQQPGHQQESGDQR